MSTRWLAFLGDGGYDLGARAAQIRDDLLALQTATTAGHAGDPAGRPCAVPHALARSVRWACSTMPRSPIIRCGAQARQLSSNGPRTRPSTTRAIASCVRHACRFARTFSNRSRQRRASDFRRRSSRPRRSSKGRCGSSSRSGRMHLLDPHYTSWQAALLGSIDRALERAAERLQRAVALHMGRGERVAHAASAVAVAVRSRAAGSTCRSSRCPATTHAARAGRAFGASERLGRSRPGAKRQGYAADAGRAGRIIRCRRSTVRATTIGRRAGRRRSCPAPRSTPDAAPSCYSAELTSRLSRSESRCPHAFHGTDSYVATEDLMMAVNAAVTLGRPLLVKGEPGTGKTQLAEEIARALGGRCIGGTSSRRRKAQQGLYEYDAVSRLRDSQLGEEKVHDIRNYIVKGRLWEAFERERAAGAADRRDRQGRHRVPERPAARARPHGVLRLRDARAGQGARTGRSSSSPATTRRSCRTRSCAAASSTTSASRTRRRWSASSTCTSRISRRELLRGGARRVLQGARDAGPEEEALDLRAARLAQAAARRGHPARSAAHRRSAKKPSRRCTARCSRTSRTCTCSSSWCSCTGAQGR